MAPLVAPETSAQTESQRATAAIIGALAHEVNNPLQGILTLVTLWGRECVEGEQSRSRLEQIRGGLTRIARTVASFAVVYENLPRPPDRIPAQRLVDWLVAALAEREVPCEVHSETDLTTPILTFGPEFVRLAADALAQAGTAGHGIRIVAETGEEYLILSCMRWPPESESDWLPVAALGGFSGLAILIHELTQLCQGECTFRVDTAALSGIRLMFRIRMV